MKIEVYWYSIFYFLHIITNYYLITYTNNTNIKNISQLPDILLDTNIYFPELLPYMDIIAIFFCIPLIFNNMYKNFEELFKFFGIITFFRNITTFSTILPSIDGRFLEERTDTNYFLNYITGHNYDKIFSGHAAFVIICILITINNNLFNDYNLILIFLGIIYTFLIIFTKQHYTVDVVLSYMIVIPLYFSLRNTI